MSLLEQHNKVEVTIQLDNEQVWSFWYLKDGQCGGYGTTDHATLNQVLEALQKAVEQAKGFKHE